MRLAEDFVSKSDLAVAFTLVVFIAAQRLQKRWPAIPLFNPTLVAVCAVVSILEVTQVPYPRYLASVQVINFMLLPAIILLAVPLYRRLALIKCSWRIIAAGLLIGLPTGVLTAVATAMMFGAGHDTVYSISSKSVTAGIAVGIARSIGTIPAFAAVLAIMTGIVGAAFGPILLRLFNIRDERAVGMAMGVSAHGIGTARAFQISETTGAFSSLAMVLNGILTALIIPIGVAFVEGDHTRASAWSTASPTSIDAAAAAARAAWRSLVDQKIELMEAFTLILAFSVLLLLSMMRVLTARSRSATPEADHPARIAELERLIGRQAIELENARRTIGATGRDASMQCDRRFSNRHESG